MKRILIGFLIVVFYLGFGPAVPQLPGFKAQAQESDGGSDGGSDSDGGDGSDGGGDTGGGTGGDTGGGTGGGGAGGGGGVSGGGGGQSTKASTRGDGRGISSRSGALAKEKVKAEDEANAEQVAQVVRRMRSAGATCAAVGAASQADCMGRKLAQIAKAVPSRGSLVRVKAAVARSAARLNGIVRQNAERGGKRGQPFVPVRQDAVRISAAKANTVLRQLAVEIAGISPPSGAAKERAQLRLLAQQVKTMRVAVR